MKASDWTAFSDKIPERGSYLCWNVWGNCAQVVYIDAALYRNTFRALIDGSPHICDYPAKLTHWQPIEPPNVDKADHPNPYDGAR